MSAKLARSVAAKLYLLDIEGTVAPISFVTDTLFPYARTRFADFLSRRNNDESVRADLALLAEENRNETGEGVPRISPVVYPDDPRSPRFRLDAMVYLTWLMDRDRKSTALKSLQGKIWKIGFESGELKGALYADVPAALHRWSEQAQAAIYSSGSVEAQQLLFRYSVYGDLTSHLSAYFDTRTGAKTVAASYTAIAEAMGVATDEVLFFSDVIRELDPAREAGCQTRLVVREGNAAVEDSHGHDVVASFDTI